MPVTVAPAKIEPWCLRNAFAQSTETSSAAPKSIHPTLRYAVTDVTIETVMRANAVGLVMLAFDRAIVSPAPKSMMHIIAHARAQ